MFKRLKEIWAYGNDNDKKSKKLTIPASIQKKIKSTDNDDQLDQQHEDCNDETDYTLALEKDIRKPFFNNLCNEYLFNKSLQAKTIQEKYRKRFLSFISSCTTRYNTLQKVEDTFAIDHFKILEFEKELELIKK